MRDYEKPCDCWPGGESLPHLCIGELIADEELRAALELLRDPTPMDGTPWPVRR